MINIDESLADISNIIDGYPSGISCSSSFDGIISTTYHGGKYSLFQTNVLETLVIYITMDGGKNWKPEGVLDCSDVFNIFSDNSMGYIVDSSGKLYEVKW